MQRITRDRLRALLDPHYVRVYEDGKADWAQASLPFVGTRSTARAS